MNAQKVPAPTPRGPLAGLRVLEFAGLGPAPFACMLLSGMGPLTPPVTIGGKLFAGIYALYSGFAVLVIASATFVVLSRNPVHSVLWLIVAFFNAAGLMVLVGAEWKDARFTFSGAGTEAAPILIRPETSGGAVFTGKSEVIFHGSNLVVQGLTFRGVNPARDGAVILRAGDGEAKPADHCIFTGLTFDHCGSTEAADWPRQKLWLMSMRGSDNTVAGCRFAGLKHIGQMIGAAELPKTGLQRLHVLNNRFTDRPKIDAQNGYEILQIGWSGESAKGAGSLIEGNTFENCDGENEIISLKASDVLVRGNFFFGCQGVLSLRSANRVRVEGNVFDGKGKANTGGITAEGADHVISGNTFRNLKAPKDYYFWTLAFLSASAENIGDNGDVAGYGRAKNILIVHNRFEQCDARIAVGAYPRKEYPLLPRDIRVEDNVFVGMKGPSVFDYLAPDAEGKARKTWREVRNVFER